MNRRPYAVAALIAVLATPGCQESPTAPSTTTPPELEDDAEAVRWYRLAAEQGDASAQYSLGVMYDFGRGVLEDDAEAVRWYRLAAEQGDADAQNRLGSQTSILARSDTGRSGAGRIGEDGSNAEWRG